PANPMSWTRPPPSMLFDAEVPYDHPVKRDCVRAVGEGSNNEKVAIRHVRGVCALVDRRAPEKKRDDVVLRIGKGYDRRLHPEVNHVVDACTVDLNRGESPAIDIIGGRPTYRIDVAGGLRDRGL